MKKTAIILSFLVFCSLILPLAVMAAEAQPTAQSSVLEKEIAIPAGLQGLARVLFGIKPDAPVTFQEFIVLVAAFIIFFFIIRDIIVLVPFFDTTIKSIVGAILVTLLTGISGGFLLFVDMMMSLGSFFGILERWPIIVTTLIIVILVVVVYFLNKFLVEFKRKSGIEAAEIEGLKTGAASKIIQREAGL